LELFKVEQKYGKDGKASSVKSKRYV